MPVKEIGATWKIHISHFICKYCVSNLLQGTQEQMTPRKRIFSLIDKPMQLVKEKKRVRNENVNQNGKVII